MSLSAVKHVKNTEQSSDYYYQSNQYKCQTDTAQYYVIYYKLHIAV